jgi:hypothetical protein
VRIIQIFIILTYLMNLEYEFEEIDTLVNEFNDIHEIRDEEISYNGTFNPNENLMQ